MPPTPQHTTLVSKGSASREPTLTATEEESTKGSTDKHEQLTEQGEQEGN